MQKKLLLVDFDKNAAQTTAKELCSYGWNVDFECADEDRAMEQIQTIAPDAVVIDLEHFPERSQSLE